MTAKTKLSSALLFILFVSSIASFHIFSVYVPKASEKSIKGAFSQNLGSAKDIKTNFVSVPFSSEEISKSISDNGSQVVVLTSKKPSEIQAFYANLLRSSWVLEYSNLNNDSYLARYKSDKQAVVINSNKDLDSGKQVLTIDYLKSD